jgi:hypothetical protein
LQLLLHLCELQLEWFKVRGAALLGFELGPKLGSPGLESFQLVDLSRTNSHHSNPKITRPTSRPNPSLNSRGQLPVFWKSSSFKDIFFFTTQLLR